MGSDQDYNTQVGFPVIPNLESTYPIRKEMGENPSLGDLRPSNHEAQASTMSNAPHEASVAQVVISGHRDEFMREVDTTGAGGSHAEESPTPLEKADIVRNQSLKTAMSLVGQTKMMGRPAKASVVTQCPFSNGFGAEDSLATLDRADIALIHTTRTDTMFVPLIENMGCLVKTSVEAECLIFYGSCIDKPPITLGKAKTKGDRALIGLVLSNYVLSPSRVGTKELGVQGGDEGGRVDCVSDIQGIDTSHQANQLVLALTEVETASADEGLGDVDSFSLLMTINPLGLVVSAELNSNIEVMGFDNTLNVSNWVKHRLFGFSKMMGLSLGRHEKMCIMLSKA